MTDRQSKRERLVIELQHGSAFRSLCLMAMLDTEDPEFPGKFDHHGASSHTLTGFFHQGPVQGYTQLVSWITKRKRVRVCVRIARLRGGSTADLNSFPCAGVGFQKSTVHESAAAARVGVQIDVSFRRRRKLITPSLLGSNRR